MQSFSITGRSFGVFYTKITALWTFLSEHGAFGAFRATLKITLRVAVWIIGILFEYWDIEAWFYSVSYRVIIVIGHERTDSAVRRSRTFRTVFSRFAFAQLTSVLAEEAAHLYHLLLTC